MKIKDLLFLSRQSVKVNSKISKKSKFIYILSMVFVIVSFYILLSYNAMTKEVLKMDSIREFTISYNDYDAYKKASSIFDGKISEELDTEYMIYTLRSTREDSYFPQVSIGDKTYIYKEYNGEYVRDYISLGFVDDEISTSLMKKFVKDKYKSSGIIAGKGNVLENEMIISNKTLENLNLTVDDVLNKEISITLKERDYTNNVDKVSSLWDGKLKIVGVYDDKLVECSDYLTYFGYINRKKIDNMLNIKTNKPIKYSILDAKSNADLEEIYLMIDEYQAKYRELDSTSWSFVSISVAYDDYMFYRDYFNFIGRLLIIINAVMFIILLLNFYITIRFEFFRNKHHFQMCRVLGFKNREIFIYYNLYLLAYLASIFVISLCASLCVSIPITIVLNNLLDRTGFSSAYTYQLSMGYFPLAFVIILIVNLLILLVMSISVYFSNKNEKVNNE